MSEHTLELGDHELHHLGEVLLGDEVNAIDDDLDGGACLPDAAEGLDGV